MYNFQQLIPTLVKSLTASPIHEGKLKENEESSSCDLSSSKDKDLCVEAFADKVVEEIVKEVEKVCIDCAHNL